jgi:hypothetical protein
MWDGEEVPLRLAARRSRASVLATTRLLFVSGTAPGFVIPEASFFDDDVCPGALDDRE